MNPDAKLASAFWAAAEADAHFAGVLRKLHQLQLQISDELNEPMVDILDEFQAGLNHLQASRYDLQILFRAEKKKAEHSNSFQ